MKVELNPRGTRRRLKKRRTAVRIPGGKTAYHYRHKRHKPAKCSHCGRPLNATPTGPRSLMKGLSKSQKRPNRPYGGFLCSSCFHRVMTARALDEGERLLKGLPHGK